MARVTGIDSSHYNTCNRLTCNPIIAIRFQISTYIVVNLKLMPTKRYYISGFGQRGRVSTRALCMKLNCTSYITRIPCFQRECNSDLPAPFKTYPCKSALSTATRAARDEATQAASATRQRHRGMRSAVTSVRVANPASIHSCRAARLGCLPAALFYRSRKLFGI